MKSQLMLQESKKEKFYPAGKWKGGNKTKVDAGVLPPTPVSPRSMKAIPTETQDWTYWQFLDIWHTAGRKAH